MVNYESLLLGGYIRGGDNECTLARKTTALKVARKVKAAKRAKACAYGGGLEDSEEDEMKGGDNECTLARKMTALKVARKVKKAKKDKQCAYSGGGMTYEQRLKNLEKARAVRAKNLAEKKKMAGKGQYNQDYVDESQINYAGSPLDMYYLGSQKEMEHEKEQRGEVAGSGKRRGRKMKVKEIEEDSEEEEMEGGRMMRGRGMEFMEHSMHTGMSMPTPEQFQRGGKLAKKGRKKMMVEDLEGGAMGSVDIPEAIKVLGVLASKFGLRLSK